MAPSESTGVSGDNVTDLAEARRLREQSHLKEGQSGPAAEGADAASGTAADSVPGNASRTTKAVSGSKKRTANRRFDTEKVERLKAEIAAGRYRMDPLRVADKFIEHDRNA